MAYQGFPFDGARAVLARPADKAQAVAGATWAKDKSAVGSNDGTEITATWLNRIKANLESLIAWAGPSAAVGGGDNQLKLALEYRFGLGYTKTETDAAFLAKSGGTMSGALTLAGDAVNALHPVSLQQLQNALAGLDPKASVKAATTANITLSGTQTIDGVALAVGERVLVKNQTTSSQNGIYVVASGAWSRATDMDAWSEVPGATTIVENGTTLADSGWLCSADQGGTLGSTAITWLPWFGSGIYQTASALLTNIAALSMVADRIIYGTGSNAVALATLTAFARSLLDDADAATARATLGAEPQGELFAVNPQTGTSYTFVLADKGKRVSGSNASAITLTVPPNSSVAFPVNSRIELFQEGAGQITVAAGAGVTIRSSGSKLKLSGQYSAAVLTKTATDTWDLVGDISA